MKKKTKNTIIKTVLVVAALLAVIACFGVFLNRDKAPEGFDLVKVSYEVGSLDSAGKYAESKSHLYTKEAIECQGGVRVDLEFDSSVTFQVFYYDEDDTFIESTETFEKTATTEAPADAVYARILVTPIWGDDVEEDDQTIYIFNKNKFTKQLVVSVAEVEESES